ncbi:MAG: hypothetical protein AAFY31_11400 [Pseudomonadota bacterium]
MESECLLSECRNAAFNRLADGGSGPTELQLKAEVFKTSNPNVLSAG